MRHVRAIGWSLLAGGFTWLLVMLSGSGCIAPPETELAARYWEPRPGCLALTVTPYWVFGVLGGLIVFTVVMGHFYTSWRISYRR